jgi:hypothetical protein
MKDNCSYSPGTNRKESTSGHPAVAGHSPPRSLPTSPVEHRQGRLQPSQPARKIPLDSPSSGRSATGRKLFPDNPVSSVIDSMTTVLEDGACTEQYFGRSSAGSFTNMIKAAIDARLGNAPSTSPHDPALPGVPGDGNTSIHVDDSDSDYALPSRKQADQYMDLYWFYVDPLYPFLDQSRWNVSYNDFFAGTTTSTDERLFVATLNIIFALSAQLMESWDSEKREKQSNIYCQRAQSLVRFDFWAPASIGLVQCLLLLSQYLQSTNNPHQTWMAVGAAIRTAQSLGLHLPETSARLSDPAERGMFRRLWYGCVLMDRLVSLPF